MYCYSPILLSKLEDTSQKLENKLAMSHLSTEYSGERNTPTVIDFDVSSGSFPSPIELFLQSNKTNLIVKMSKKKELV